MKQTALILGLFAFLTVASAGHETHGGDMAVSLFYKYAEGVKSCLPLIEEEDKAEINALFIETFRKTKVFSQERTIINGEEVDAINIPDVSEPRIYVNRNRWLTSTVPAVLIYTLVLHEYLNLMGYDDSHYAYSNRWIPDMITCLESK